MSGGTALDPRTASPFPMVAAVAVRDKQMRKNVRHATEVIHTKRGRVVAERNDWDALREAVKSLREHAIQNMEGYLLEFERNCTRAGDTVHWARDAADSRSIGGRTGVRDLQAIPPQTFREWWEEQADTATATVKAGVPSHGRLFWVAFGRPAGECGARPGGAGGGLAELATRIRSGEADEHRGQARPAGGSPARL